MSFRRTSIKKERKKRKNISKQMCVSSQTHRMKKEEGATVGVCRPFCSLPFLSGEIVRAGLARAERAAILHGDLTLQESPIKYRKCPTFDANRWRFLDFILIGPPKQMKQTKQKRCSRV
jgi:hypothetical protein